MTTRQETILKAIIDQLTYAMDAIDQYKLTVPQTEAHTTPLDHDYDTLQRMQGDYYARLGRLVDTK